MPPQLEKNHVVPTAWQDEALARDGVSSEVPCSALKGETVPDSLPATPMMPVYLNMYRITCVCVFLCVFADADVICVSRSETFSNLVEMLGECHYLLKTEE